MRFSGQVEEAVEWLIGVCEDILRDQQSVQSRSPMV
jgi:hypothetical protein